MRAQEKAVLKALIAWSPQSTKALHWVNDGFDVIRDPGRTANHLRARGLVTCTYREKGMAYWSVTDAGLKAMGLARYPEDREKTIPDSRLTPLKDASR